MIKDIAIGIVSGIVSGVIVSGYYRRADKRRERKLSFELDKQSYSKYLGLVILELEIYVEKGKNDSLLRLLEGGSIQYSFIDKNLYPEATDLIDNSRDILDKLKQKVMYKEKITEHELLGYNIELFTTELEILKIKLKK